MTLITHQFYSRESSRIALLESFYAEGYKIWKFTDKEQARNYANLRVQGMDFIKAFRKSKTGILSYGNRFNQTRNH